MQKKIKTRLKENNLTPPAPNNQSAPTAAQPATGAQQLAPAPAPGAQQQAPAAATPPETGAQQPVKKRPVKPVNHESLLRNIKRILGDMITTDRGDRPMTMLTGDTGIGKTSFVKLLSKIFGIPELIIEVPQVVGEHIINIPFVIINNDGKMSAGTDKIDVRDPKKYKVVYGRSYIMGSLDKMKKLSDAEWREHYKNLDDNTRTIVDEIESRYPGKIKLIRSKFERILFLDEYLRTAPMAVRNVLRDLMVGQIGSDTVPRGTYILYASNITDSADGSLDDLATHQRFNFADFSPPTKDEWLSFTLSQLTKENIEIKEDVVESFEKSLRDEHISYNDAETQLRTSPRRWTEIFVYLNQMYPFKDAATAAITYRLMKRQFSETSAKNSRISKAFSDVLEKMIKDLCRKSTISEKDFVTVVTDSSPADFNDALAQNIMVMTQAKGLKKYVPVVLGLPGIGKSTLMASFEKPPYNLRIVTVNSQNLSRDDVVGITLPEESETDGRKEMAVAFSEPPLYIRIKKSIEDAEQNYQKYLNKQEAAGKIPSAKEALDNFNKQEYKYLIFFDEINRISDVTIFNALRRVILEKEFNPDYKLPKTALVVGAMNPDDIATSSMTGHFKDAIEIVDAAPKWKSYVEYLKNNYGPYMVEEGASDAAANTAIEFVEQFPKVFSDSKSDSPHREFYFSIGETQNWISPRDFTKMAGLMMAQFDLGVDEVIGLSKRRKLSDNEEIQIIVNDVQQVVEGTIKGILKAEKLDLDQPDIYDKINHMLEIIISKNFTKTAETAELDSLLDSIVEGQTTDISDDGDWLNYMSNYQSNTFADEFRGYLKNKFNKSGPDNAQEFNDAMTKISQAIAPGLENFDADILDRLGEAYRDIGRYIASINKSDIDIGRFLVNGYKKYRETLDNG